MSKEVTNENRAMGGSLLVTTVFANVFDDKRDERFNRWHCIKLNDEDVVTVNEEVINVHKVGRYG
jgi:hypothetical protein